MKVPLSRPDITELEREAVLRVLETSTLSLGPEVSAFEEELAACAGVRHAVVVNSGTSALHLAVAALGLGPGDEVITTPFSFVASANCILFEGATPVFADIDPRTLSLEPRRVEERITEDTKAILAVDVFGHPALWEQLDDLADRYGLALIEDSAEAIGATYRDRPAGSFGDAAIFAFYPNKQITTGEGGAVLTDDDEIASMARSLRNQGRGTDGGWLAHQMLGYNFRISDINCALGRAQLSRLDEIVASRASVAETYNRLLEDVAEIQTPYVASEIKMSWFVYVVQLIPEFNQEDRDQILEYLRDRGIGCSNYFPCIHLEPFYRTNFEYGPGEFPIAEGVSDRSIALPFYGKLELNDAERVVETLQQAIAHVRTSRQV